MALIEKRKSDVGEPVSDEQAAVDVSYTTKAQRLWAGLPPLDLATIKDFLYFIASVSNEIIDDENKLVTAESLNTFAELGCHCSCIAIYGSGCCT